MVKSFIYSPDFLVAVYFFWLLPQHVEVSEPEIGPEPQQPRPQQWQCWTLNPLCHKGAPIGRCFFFPWRWFLPRLVILSRLFVVKNEDHVDDFVARTWAPCAPWQALGWSRLASLQGGLEGNWLPVRLRACKYKVRRALFCTKSPQECRPFLGDWLCLFGRETSLLFPLGGNEASWAQGEGGRRTWQSCLTLPAVPIFPSRLLSSILYAPSPSWEPVVHLSWGWALPYLEAFSLAHPHLFLTSKTILDALGPFRFPSALWSWVYFLVVQCCCGFPSSEGDAGKRHVAGLAGLKWKPLICH